jgi:hypothetical protein
MYMLKTPYVPSTEEIYKMNDRVPGFEGLIDY